MPDSPFQLACERTLADGRKVLIRPLRRDVIFAAVADEENGCTWGSEWLVANHPERVRAEFALGEVGGFTLAVGPVA